jgi:hypothetical protein
MFSSMNNVMEDHSAIQSLSEVLKTRSSSHRNAVLQIVESRFFSIHIPEEQCRELEKRAFKRRMVCYRKGVKGCRVLVNCANVFSRHAIFCVVGKDSKSLHYLCVPTICPLTAI